MATGLFDLAAEQLERHTDLDRLEARGTLRLAVKEAGLDPKGITLGQLQVVFNKVMPNELKVRGIDTADSTCQAIMKAIASNADPAEAGAKSSVDDIFQRLGGR
jgi:hypothetical protein